MRHRPFLVGLAAAGLLIAGCGSNTGGTPSAAVTTAESVTSASSESPSAASSAESSESSDTESSESTAPSESSSSSEDTAGSSAGSFDQTTITWFDTFCSGMGPVVALNGLSSQVDTKDLAGTYKKIAGPISKAGEAINTTGAKLEKLPPPTFEGGDKYASTTIAAFKKAGPELVALGKTLQTADPTDPSTAAELGKLGTDLQAAAKPLLDLADLDPAVSSQIAQIDSCRTLAS